MLKAVRICDFVDESEYGLNKPLLQSKHPTLFFRAGNIALPQSKVLSTHPPFLFYANLILECISDNTHLKQATSLLSSLSICLMRLSVGARVDTRTKKCGRVETEIAQIPRTTLKSPISFRSLWGAVVVMVFAGERDF